MSKLNINNHVIKNSLLGNGVYQMTFFINEAHHPLGWVQYLPGKIGDQLIAEILYVEVIKQARGAGISELLQAELLKSFDILISGRGTDEGLNKKIKLGWKMLDIKLWYFTKQMQKDNGN